MHFFLGALMVNIWLFLGNNQYWHGRVYVLCVYFMSGAPEGSSDSGSGEAGDRTCDPCWLNFMWLGSNQYRAGRDYDLCGYFMTEEPCMLNRKW